MTWSQVPQGQKASQRGLTFMDGGGSLLDRKVLREEQVKDQDSVGAFCWLQKGSRPDKSDKEEILPTGIDTKFLWGNFNCLVVQDSTFCKKVGSLIDSSMKVTV